MKLFHVLFLYYKYEIIYLPKIKINGNYAINKENITCKKSFIF